jgi:putative membrane protein
MLSEEGRDLIAAATARAEAATTGEIACIVTEEVSAYREVPLAVGVVLALAVPPLAVALGLSLEDLAAPFAGWTAAHGPAAAGPILTVYAFLQVVLFVAGVGLGAIPVVRRALTPNSLKQRRVRRAAMQHFSGARQRLAAELPMILIFASLSDRQMEVIADETIHAKVGQQAWDGAVAEALRTIRAQGTAAGLARAVEICGATLAAHFPDDGAANALSDRPVEI